MDYIAEEKQRLRNRFFAERESCPVLSPARRRYMRDRLLSVIYKTEKKHIACVWPLPGEIDLRPLCLWLHRADYTVLLPQTPPRGQALIFRRWTSAAPLRKGRFGTFYPSGLCGAPDVILVPCMAFDRSGWRLGYGGGYYDRSLQIWPEATRIGYAMAIQECARIPTDSYDQQLDMIVTERDVLSFGNRQS